MSKEPTDDGETGSAVPASVDIMGGAAPKETHAFTLDAKREGSAKDETAGTESTEEKSERPRFFAIGTFVRAAADRLKRMCRPGRQGEPHFSRHLRAIAAAADGLGPGLREPDPIVAVAQRGMDFASLALLAEQLETSSDASRKPFHTVRLAAEAPPAHSPDRLAEELAANLPDVRNEIILLVLQSQEITPDWMTIGRSGDDTALKHFLRRTGNRLIVGLEPSSTARLSRLSKAERGISPLPFGLPLLARLAALNDYPADPFDEELIEGLDAAIAWRDARDDQREYRRFQQFDGLATIEPDPDEMSARLASLLADDNFDLKAVRAESEARVGVALHARAPEDALRAPLAVRRALLCTAAFATGLSSDRFLGLLRAALPEEHSVGLSDVTIEEREELMLLSGLQGSEHRILPALPSLRAYFDTHADRLLRFYDIERNEDGHMGPGKSWRALPLAAHIAERAPHAAIDYAARLLAAESEIEGVESEEARSCEEAASGEAGSKSDRKDPLLGVLATLQFHLRSGLGPRDLADVLLERSLRPIANQDRQALLEEMAEGAAWPPEGARSTMDEMARVARALADTIVAYLTEFRKAAAGSGREGALARESTPLKTAVLGRITNRRVALMLALLLILLDEAAEPEEHEILSKTLEKAISRPDGIDLLLATLSIHFTKGQAGDRRSRCTGASALLAVLDRGARKPNAHSAWRTARDRVLFLFLNFDIRWPPSNGRLLPYAIHRVPVALSLCVEGEKHASGPAILRQGSGIVANAFFARGARRWLAESWRDGAVAQAPPRLYDTMLVLLDGPPEAALSYWKNRSHLDAADRVINTLVRECGAGDITSLDGYRDRLAECPDYLDPPVASLPYVRIYALFWPALLLFWRLQLFGVGPTKRHPLRDDFAAFLHRLRDAASPVALADMADGMKRLVAALDRAVLYAITQPIDPAAHAFYAGKRDVAAKLETFLRSGMPARGGPER